MDVGVYSAPPDTLKGLAETEIQPEIKSWLAQQAAGAVGFAARHPGLAPRGE
jgi:hypothetical protein